MLYVKEIKTTMTNMIDILNNPPQEIILPDDVIKEIWEDTEADYIISAEKEHLI